jgi:hypothetical protein
MDHRPDGPGLICPTAMAVRKSGSCAQPSAIKSACRKGRLPSPPNESSEAFRKMRKNCSG